MLIGDDTEGAGLGEMLELVRDPHEGPLFAPFLSGRTVTDAERAAYARFLVARGDVRGEVLTLAIALAPTPPPPDAAERRARLAQLLPEVPPIWWQMVRAPGYQLNCGAAATEPAPIRFAFRCPQSWETLAATADPSVRHCEACGVDVHRADTIVAAEALARRGRCITVPAAVAEVAGYPDGRPMITGRPEHPVRRWARKLFE